MYQYSINKLSTKINIKKSLFLNTLKCNHLPTMTEKHKIILFIKREVQF